MSRSYEDIAEGRTPPSDGKVITFVIVANVLALGGAFFFGPITIIAGVCLAVGYLLKSKS